MIDINKYKYPLMESQCDGDYVQNMVWSGGHENNKKDKNDVSIESYSVEGSEYSKKL